MGHALGLLIIPRRIRLRPPIALSFRFVKEILQEVANNRLIIPCCHRGTRITSSGAFYNCKVNTLARGKATAQAIAFEDGRITSIGTNEEVLARAPRGFDTVDLKGRCVLPGFIDCHTHFISMGVFEDLSGAATLQEVLAKMKDRAKVTPEGDWVVGAGWKETSWVGGRYITKEDLDACCPNHPAIAYRNLVHFASVNSATISKLGISAKTEGAETDSSGNLTGILRERAVLLAASGSKPNRNRRLEGLKSAVAKAHSLGVTSIQDMGDPGDFSVYKAAERKRALQVRVWLSTPASNRDSKLARRDPTGTGSDWLKLGGVKVFCDGSLGARTAALTKPYSDEQGNRGMFIHTEQELRDIVSQANSAGFQLAVHAIGDDAIERTVSCIAEALEEQPSSNHRHRIEHLSMPSKPVLQRMQSLGIIASMQPNFIGKMFDMHSMYLARLGPGRIQRSNPFRKVLESRVKLIFGSDCEPLSPLYGIESVTNAPYDAQRISVVDAVTSYTKNAAFGSFEEAHKGTLEVGKFADFVVLSGNLLDGSRRASSVQVLKTVVGGDVVFEKTGRH